MIRLERRLLSFSGAEIELPPDTLAVGLTPGVDEGAVLHRDGEISRISQEGLSQIGEVDWPSQPDLAAISPDGRCVAISAGTDVWGGRPGSLVRAYDHEWLDGVTALAAADDGSFGYAFETGQPWNDYGSYGSRTRGVLFCSERGDLLLDQRDERSHDEQGARTLLWRGSGRPFASRLCHHYGSSEISVAWPGPHALIERVVCSDADIRSFSVSPCGEMAAVVTHSGTLAICDRRTDETLYLSEDAIGAHLRRPNRVTWLDRGGSSWEQKIIEELPDDLEPLLDGSEEGRAVLRDWAIDTGCERLLR